jgi:hypothetical protein
MAFQNEKLFRHLQLCRKADKWKRYVHMRASAVLCRDVVHTSVTADSLCLTWEGSTSPADLLTSYYYIHMLGVCRSARRTSLCPLSSRLYPSCLCQQQNLHWAFVLWALRDLWDCVRVEAEVTFPTTLCWHSAVPWTRLRHLRRNAPPVLRHMPPTNMNWHSTKPQKVDVLIW